MNPQVPTKFQRFKMGEQRRNPMTAPSSRKQENNFSSQAVAARDLRNVPSDTYLKAINETVESVGNFILVDTKR